MSALVVATGAGVAIYFAQARPDGHFPVPLDEPLQTWRWGSCELVANTNPAALPWQSCGRHGCRELAIDDTTNLQPWEPRAALDGNVPVIAVRMGQQHAIIRGERRVMSVFDSRTCAFAWLKLVPMWRGLAVGEDAGYEIAVDRSGAVSGSEIADILKLDLGTTHDSECYATDSDLVQADRPARPLDVPRLGPGEQLHVLANNCSLAVMLVVEPLASGSALVSRIKRVVIAPTW